MRWVFSETRAYKRVLSAREDYCAWIGAQSAALVFAEGQVLSYEDLHRP
jgi:hypothetical protein